MKIIAILAALAVVCGSAAAQAVLIPIVDMKIGGIIGAVRADEWVTAAEAEPKLGGGGRYVWFKFDGSTEMLTGKKPVNDEPCEDFYYVGFEGRDDERGTAMNGCDLEPDAAETARGRKVRGGEDIRGDAHPISEIRGTRAGQTAKHSRLEDRS